MVGTSPVGVRHDHLVDLYDDDAELSENVAAYFLEGLCQGETALLISTPAHRGSIEAALADAGIDLQEAGALGQYIPLDAGETLTSFTKDGQPDRQLFRNVICGVLDGVGTDRPVRAFGEMVALLWNDGKVTEAMRLEGLWNELLDDRKFTLYCAYKLSSVTGAGDVTLATQVCGLHSSVVPPRSYTSGVGDVVSEELRGSVMLIPVPTAAGVARRFVSEVLRGWDLHELVGVASIVTSELATNAYRHAGSAFRVSIVRVGDAVRIDVEDGDTTSPRIGEPSKEDSAGLGLQVVERLAVDWGVEPRPYGKTVWAVVARP